ncbi:MAG: hypothetical protein BGO82_07580 [Devosia sp. 67-54]|nr:helix-turn-helix transcriptional regulator [Devosia sp.]OJX19577.1 MAG: hypothetical protein BGO82_07580 [Devosia sp. 67-54]
MKPQFVTTPSGEEMVLLSRADYDTLIDIAAEAEEDAADVAMFDARMADPEGREPLPQPVSEAILKQRVSLLKAIRLWRELGQQEVAAAAEISQGFLSDLENRKRKLTPDIARKLARVLDVPDRWLV